MLLVEQGQGNCLFEVEELREGQARCRYVVLTIEFISKNLARKSNVPYHALIIAWDSIRKHSVAKLVKAICWVALGTLLQEVRQVSINSHDGDITTPVPSRS